MEIIEKYEIFYNLLNDIVNLGLISNHHYSGIAAIKIEEDGAIKYLTCERAYKNQCTYNDIGWSIAHYKGEKFYFRIADIKESLFQEISIGKLLNKMVYVVSKIKDYDKDYKYYISYNNVKDRKTAEIEITYKTNLPYHQQVLPKYVVDTLINTWNSYFTPMKGEIKIVKGEDIRKYYWRKYYWRNEDIDENLDWEDDWSIHVNTSSNSEAFDKGLNGSLLGSCMRYGGCRDFMDIYVNNPNNIKMAVWLIDDLVVARCLIWFIEDNKYFDRVYSVDSVKEYGLKKYLEDKGYIYIYKHSKKLEVELKCRNIDKYPYMDTFKYKNDNWFYNWEQDDCITLENTDGTWEEDEDDYVYSNYEGESIDRDEAIYIEDRDDFVYSNNAVLDSRGEWRLKDDCTYSDIMGKWVYDDDKLDYYSEIGVRDVVDKDKAHRYSIVFSERNEDYYHEDLVVYVYELNDYLTNEQYDEYKQEIAKENTGNSEFQLQLF